MTVSMQHRLARRAGAIVVGALVLGGQTAQANEERARPRPETFEDVTEVFEVQIPVNVVGRDGEAVRDLAAEHFQVLDGGQRQEIVDFEVVDLEIIEPGASRTEVERAVEAAGRRHFLFLFDLSFSTPTKILRAREAARRVALERLHPTDLAAVGTHSVESGARLLVTFTPDRAQLARAIDTLGAPRLLGLHRRDPLNFLIERPELATRQASRDLVDESRGNNALQEAALAHMRVIGKEIAKAEKGFQRGRISSWSRSMGDLARMLDSIQGRKHVIYFSEGFDGRLLFGRRPAADNREMQQDLLDLQLGNHWAVDTDDFYGNTSLQGEVGQMLEEFRRANCVIQTVDISGLTADSAAEERAASVGQDALFYLANDTGGELFEDASDFENQLERLLEHTSVTYLLTIRPRGVALDGEFHRLKVKADLPRGARLTARQGYYAPRPFQELHPLEKALMASDAIASAAPRADLEMNVLTAPFKASEIEAYVPVIIEVAGSSLLEAHDDDQLPVEFFAYVTDERGEMKDFFTQLVTLDLSQNRRQFERTGLKYYGHLNLEPGRYLVRVLVRNAFTGTSGVETIELEVPTYELAEPQLLPPFFMEAAGNWFLVREATGPGSDRSVVYPFTVNGEPYIPAARPAMKRRDEARLCLVAYNLGKESPRIDTRIVSEDGREVEGGSLDQVERTVTGIDGLDKFVARFRPHGLEAGRYTLQVALIDPSTGARESTSIPFSLLN